MEMRCLSFCTNFFQSSKQKQRKKSVQKREKFFKSAFLCFSFTPNPIFLPSFFLIHRFPAFSFFSLPPSNPCKHKRAEQIQSPTMIPIKVLAAMAVCLPLIVAAALEMRPSEHGLEFQSPPPAGDKSSPEMRSFFGGVSTPTPDVALPLPKVMNSSEAPGWWSHRDGGNKRLRNALLVATAACGITGVTLLVGSTLFYIYKVKNQSSLPLVSANNK